MSGIYWCLNAMDIMGGLSQMDTVAIVDYVKDCQQQNGGFAPAIGHDAHLLHTLSAVQVGVIVALFFSLFCFILLLIYHSFSNLSPTLFQDLC